MILDATIIRDDLSKLDQRQVDAALDAVMGRAAAKMANRARDKAPKFTSTLAQSILPKRITYGQEWHVPAGQRYAAGLEYGGGHKGEPINRARREAIKAWVKAKGIASTPREIAAAAWHIAGKIYREGVNEQPFMRPAFEETVPEIMPDLMNTVAEALKP